MPELSTMFNSDMLEGNVDIDFQVGPQTDIF